MDVGGDVSETSSQHSAGSKVSKGSKSSSKDSKRVTASKAVAVTESATAAKKDERPVSKLRPRKPVTVSDEASILDVCQSMSLSRVDAALLVSASGGLAGILTDNDVCRRVVAKSVDPLSTCVSEVMTAGPKCVRSDESALDALEMMVDNHFRHLPVLDRDGAVVGLLDIAKCLYDTISVLEKCSGGGSEEPAAAANAMSAAMTGAMAQMAGSRGTNAAQVAAMKAMLDAMFGGSMPTLRDVCGSGAYEGVGSDMSVAEVAEVMAARRKGVLVTDEAGGLVGIFTPKDLLNRVVSKELSPEDVLVSEVMTPNPDCVGPDVTLLDALREMHEHKYLHLPVRDESSGLVLGVVDVMELLCHTAGGEGSTGTGGGKGWRDFFGGAMDVGGDVSETSSQHSTGSRMSQSNSNHRHAVLSGDAPLMAMPLPAQSALSALSQSQDDDEVGSVVSTAMRSDAFSVNNGLTSPLKVGRSYNFDTASNGSTLTTQNTQQQLQQSSFVFKVTCGEGHVHRIKSAVDALMPLTLQVAEKLQLFSAGAGAAGTPDLNKGLAAAVSLFYRDDDDDEIMIGSDSSLVEAVDFARSAGLKTLKLRAVVDSKALKMLCDDQSSTNADNNVTGSTALAVVVEEDSTEFDESSTEVGSALSPGEGKSVEAPTPSAVPLAGAAESADNAAFSVAAEESSGILGALGNATGLDGTLALSLLVGGSVAVVAAAITILRKKK